jgi:epoxyqueuosine reductase
MDTATLTHHIQEEALALGFSKVGFIPAAPLQPESQHLSSWLAQGYHADMAWMVNHLDKRQNPATLMEGARSIVCVAMNYYSPLEENPAPDAVKIARYALGTDYHTVLKDRLKVLLARIQSWDPGIQGRAFTDSAPLMEKAMAIRAGLGWQGKNGNLITRDQGSWLFLGELLLNVALAYTETHVTDACGSCTRCISACPTDAIPQPGVVDATKCISYWTIEHKGDVIPDEIAQQMEGWVFGCDICQEVCPWNLKFARPTQEEAFLPRPWNRQPTATDLLALDEETFGERYRKSPVKRTKLKGLQRNVQAARQSLK